MQSGVLTPTPVVTIGGISAKVQFADEIGRVLSSTVVPTGLDNGDQTITATSTAAHRLRRGRY